MVAWLTPTSRNPGSRNSTIRWIRTVPICDAYIALAAEFGVRAVLDIGCGTGTLACLLAGRGTQVIAADPAAASLAVARRKPGADHVRWLHTDAGEPASSAGRPVTMTGNVAQAFLTGRNGRPRSGPPARP